MLSYRDWQIMNESVGRFTLGVKSPNAVGLMGSKMAEMGMLPGPSPEPGMDTSNMSAEPDLGGSKKIGINDLDPQLLQLLLKIVHGSGAAPSAPALTPVDMGDEPDTDFDLGAETGDEGPEMGEEPDDEDDLSGLGGDDEMSTLAGLDEPESDDEGGEEPSFGEKPKKPEKSEKKSEKKPSFPKKLEKEESDDEPEDEDEGDDEPAFQKKNMKKGADCRCSKMMRAESEDEFLDSFLNQGRGDVHKKWWSGIREDTLLPPESTPGQVGHAPTGRIDMFIPSEE